MIAAQLFVACLVALACGSLVTRQDASFTSLQKRGGPGTGSYNCRRNCDTAVSLSIEADFCTDPAFVRYYNNCIKCSGPDNYNIWQYYNIHDLSEAGAVCGLSTTPLPGKQEDVPDALTPSYSSTLAIASSALTSTASAQSSAAVQVSNSTAPTSGTTDEASVSSAASSVAVQTTTVASMLPSDPVHSSSSPTQTHKASGSSTTPAPSTTAANSAGSLHLEGAAGVLGSIFIGALFGM